MKIGFLTVIANVIKSYDWARIAFPLFREHFPKSFLVAVDHNKGIDKNKILDLANVILYSPADDDQGHGRGLQTGCEWLREHEFDVMVHIEQDCVYSGHQWYDNLVKAIDDGAWVSGVNTTPWGMRHIAGSAWRLDHVLYSFKICHKRNDVFDPEHERLIDERQIGATLTKNRAPLCNWRFHFYQWDSGMKNWFHCARENKAAIVPAPDFFHVWGSWRRLPHEIPEREIYFHELRRKYLGPAIF